MRRSGSPWTGVGIVLAKEAADYLSGARLWLLEALVFLTALAAAYAAILAIRVTIGESPFLFLRLFTMAQEPLPSFISLLGFLVPLVAIAIGFDAVNGELNRRTMSRVLAQPIYRDALLLGKFLAGMLALGIGLVSLWLLTIGLGLLLLGLPPNTEETLRMLGFLFAALALWRGLAGGRPVVLGGVPGGGDGGARRPRRVALVRALLVGAVTPIIATLVAGPRERRFRPQSRLSRRPCKRSTGSRRTRSMPRSRSRSCSRRRAPLGPVSTARSRGRCSARRCRRRRVSF